MFCVKLRYNHIGTTSVLPAGSNGPDPKLGLLIVVPRIGHQGVPVGTCEDDHAPWRHHDGRAARGVVCSSTCASICIEVAKTKYDLKVSN